MNIQDDMLTDICIDAYGMTKEIIELALLENTPELVDSQIIANAILQAAAIFSTRMDDLIEAIDRGHK